MSSHLQQVESKLKELAEQTDKAKASEFFKEYFETMSKFWQYSYHNQLLIHFAMPKATRIAGFKKWKELGRNVKRGSSAIKILAPYTKKVIEDEEEKEITFFIPVNVFDVSQTEGKELPQVDVKIEGDDYGCFMPVLLDFCNKNNIKVEFKNLGVNGLYGYSKGGKIVVTDAESINTQVNTMLHEIAHELLHKNNSKLSRQQKEIQAEGTAYVVMQHLGMQTKSFNYLALYDADYKKIMENLKAIAEASREIISFF